MDTTPKGSNRGRGCLLLSVNSQWEEQLAHLGSITTHHFSSLSKRFVLFLTFCSTERALHSSVVFHFISKPCGFFPPTYLGQWGWSQGDTASGYNEEVRTATKCCSRFGTLRVWTNYTFSRIFHSIPPLSNLSFSPQQWVSIQYPLSMLTYTIFIGLSQGSSHSFFSLPCPIKVIFLQTLGPLQAF